MGWDVAAAGVAAVVAAAWLIRPPTLRAAVVGAVYLLTGLVAYAQSPFFPGLALLLVSGAAGSTFIFTMPRTEQARIGPTELLQSAGSLVVTVLVAYLVTRSIELTPSPWLDGVIVWLALAGLFALVVQVPPASKAMGLLWLMLSTYTAYWVVVPQASLVALASLSVFNVAVGYLASQAGFNDLAGEG